MIDVRLLCGRWWAGGESCGLGWKPILRVTVGKCDSICLRVTTSISTPGWKPVPLILWYLVLASSQQSYATITVPRTASAVTQGIGFQPMQSYATITVPRTASTVTQSIGLQPMQW